MGVSTHTLEQLAAADRTSADYVAFGPIFQTATKKNPDPVVGTELFCARPVQITKKPLVAIGGITVGLAADVYRVGADSLAVIRDLICAPDPGARAAIISLWRTELIRGFSPAQASAAADLCGFCDCNWGA